MTIMIIIIIITIIILIFVSFSHRLTLVVFHWSLGDSMSAQISRTLNNTEVWMASIPPLISSSYNLFSNPLGTVQSEPIITGISVTLIFYSIF